MSHLRIPLIVVGGALGLAGVLVLVGAMSLLGEKPDADGFYMHHPYTFDEAAPAIIAKDVDVLKGRIHQMRSEGIGGSWVIDLPEEVRLEGRSLGPEALFVGIGPTSAVDGYLGGVAHYEITELSFERKDVEEVEGTAHQGVVTIGDPGGMDIWTVSIEGTGPQTLDWTIEPGDFTAVIMNWDASAPVAVELSFGARAPDLNSIGQRYAMIAVGLLAVGGLLLYLGLSAESRPYQVL